MASRLRTVQQHIVASCADSATTSRADEAIIRLSISDLAASIAAGKLSATVVLGAYKRRAEVVHTATNCVACWVEGAEDVAAALDRHFSATGTTIGPLHGVPCSIKDHFAVKGLWILHCMLDVLHAMPVRRWVSVFGCLVAAQLYSNERNHKHITLTVRVVLLFSCASLGTPVTMGVTALRQRGKVSKEDAAIVATLRDAGEHLDLSCMASP